MTDWLVPRGIAEILSKSGKIWGSEGVYAVYQFAYNQEWYSYFCAFAMRRLPQVIRDDHEDAVQNAFMNMFTGENPSIINYEPDTEKLKKNQHGIHIRNYILGNVRWRCLDLIRAHKKSHRRQDDVGSGEFHAAYEDKIKDSMFGDDYLAQEAYATRLFGSIFDEENSNLFSSEETLIELEDLRSEYLSLGGSESHINDESLYSDDTALYRQQIQSLIEEENIKIFRECVRELPQPQRDIIDMRSGNFGPEFEKNKNIAKRLDLTPGNVAVTFGRAVKALIQCTNLKRRES